VQVKARMGGKPAADLRGLVGRAVVEDEVDVEVFGNLLLDRLQELVELDRAVSLVQGADHLARGEIQRRVQARGAVALVVMGRALRRAGQHRQDRPGPIQRLNLRFFIHAQHRRALGRVQVQATDVVDLLDELRVGGELELLLTVRLQRERLPRPPHRVLRNAQMRRQRARRPVRGVLGRGLERGDHDPFDLLIGDRPRLPRPRLVQQSLQSGRGEALAPLRDRRTRDTQLLGDLRIRQTISRRQHDPRAPRQRLRGLAPPRPRLQAGAFILRELDCNSSRSRHARPIP
jgi:hypothetical protein